MTTSTPGFPVNGDNDDAPVRDALVGDRGDAASEGTVGASPSTTDETNDPTISATGTDQGVPVGSSDVDADVARTSGDDGGDLPDRQDTGDDSAIMGAGEADADRLRSNVRGGF